MSQGFYKVPLDEASSFLCTFNKPFGRYRMLRMPFGTPSAPEVFQRINTSIFGDIKGVHIIFDDMIVRMQMNMISYWMKYAKVFIRKRCSFQH